MIQPPQKVQYDIGASVLALVEPHPGHATTAYLPGTVVKHIGSLDIYDGRVPQSKVGFPVVQDMYLIDLDEGGSVSQFEMGIIPNPRERHNVRIQ